MQVGDVVQLPGDGKYYRVDFINESRALITPLARATRVIHTTEGDKEINVTIDGHGINISPNSALDAIPVQRLPEEIRQRLKKDVARNKGSASC